MKYKIRVETSKSERWEFDGTGAIATLTHLKNGISIEELTENDAKFKIKQLIN